MARRQSENKNGDKQKQNVRINSLRPKIIKIYSQEPQRSMGRGMVFCLQM